MQDSSVTLQQLIQSLDENHALDIKSIDVRGKTVLMDYLIICSAKSSRHLRAIANHVVTEMKQHQVELIGQHGSNDGEWMLIDFSDFVVNVMLPSARDFYNLEALWQHSTLQ